MKIDIKKIQRELHFDFWKIPENPKLEDFVHLAEMMKGSTAWPFFRWDSMIRKCFGWERQGQLGHGRYEKKLLIGIQSV